MKINLNIVNDVTYKHVKYYDIKEKLFYAETIYPLIEITPKRV
jgi:hypothetical protein